MKTDITTISTFELQRDLEESIADAELCQHALEIGVTEYSGHSVEDRLNGNIAIIDLINAELVRRGVVV